MGHQQLYWGHPWKFALNVSAPTASLIQKYGLNMCRQHFCQYTKDIGFIKLD
ncbi:40S ribosomal protein S29-like [Chionomys nivalis]|uniref:40S ribosomal protein S29-like n=1 Tax=Chionomys nivalis TaxID=269649 RepID=UPI002596D1E5|nr:40S ribosomal protein S29-like [Chionomys nivalis]